MKKLIYLLLALLPALPCWAQGRYAQYLSQVDSAPFIVVDKEHFTKDDVLKVSIDVTNTGKRAGKESVLLYSSDLIASMVPDGRRLRQFEKIDLKPGERRTVTLSLPAQDLAFVGYDGRWTLEEGEFMLTIGRETVKVVCDQTYTWDTPNR